MDNNKGPLTPKQKETLDFIKLYSDKNGYAPSMQEIAIHFELTSLSSVFERMQALVKKKYLRYYPGRSRGYVVR